MSRIGFALSMLALVAVAAWAYQVNYETQEALGRVRALQSEIARERERLRVLEVEWARLNAPDRLRVLVAEHNAELLLMPMAPDHFGEVAEIPYPPRSPLISRGLGAEIRPAMEAGPAAGPPPASDIVPIPPLVLSPRGAIEAADRSGR
ncbi:MAG: cell division protein FtsL [Pikeienuella sp.]